MIARKRSGWLAPSLILAACAGLAWFNVQQLRAPPPGPVAVAGSAPAPLPELPAEVRFDMAPVETFSAVVERPLFSPTRRPPPQGTATIESPEPELDVTLVGVIISAAGRIAIVKAKGASQFARVSAGDSFQGWTLDSIEPDRVSFRRGEIEVHIELTYEEPPPVQKPQRRKRKTREQRPQGQSQGQTPSQTPSQTGTKTQR